jgi:hypothetical protein
MNSRCGRRRFGRRLRSHDSRSRESRGFADRRDARSRILVIGRRQIGTSSDPACRSGRDGRSLCLRFRCFVGAIWLRRVEEVVRCVSRS